jgi:hypothetical protein
MRNAPDARRALLCGILLAALSGTAFAEVTVPWFNNKPRRPDRMAVFWTDTVLNQPGQPGIRGFGGRIMFFANDIDKPVKVDGSLTVFAYDDTDQDLTQTIPDRKFIFTAEQVARHYSKSKLGHSYSFWVPWDAVGGEQRIVSLVCRFEPREGGSIVSESLKQILPGRAPQLAAQPDALVQQPWSSGPAGNDPAGHEVRQASHAGPIQSAANGKAGRLEATTIQIPPNYRLQTLPRDRFLPYRPRTEMRPDRQHHSATMQRIDEQVALEALPSTVNPATPSSPSGTDPQLLAAAAQALAQALAAQSAATNPPPEAGSPPSTRRALGASIARPRHDRVPMRPRPPGWPSDPPAALQPAPANGFPVTDPSGPQALFPAQRGAVR